MKPFRKYFPIASLWVLLLGRVLLGNSCGLVVCAAADLDGAAASADAARKLMSPVRDSDGDQLTDLEESYYGSNPLLRDTDGDGKSDWEEAHNMLNPNKGPWAEAQLIDRFRFNSSDWKTDGGRIPIVSPPASQWVDSFEEKAASFPAIGSIPIVYSLTNVPLDLAYGTVRFWYISDTTFSANDSDWRTLLYARGDSGSSVVSEWTLEVQPSTRSITMKSSLGTTGQIRTNFVGKIPMGRPADQEALEICLSYTAGSTWLTVNDILITSEVAVAPGNVRGLGVDLAGVNALNASAVRRLAIGGKISASNGYEQPAQGRIDDIEWFNCAMFNPVPFSRTATPWGVTRRSADLRDFGGWAAPTADGRGIQINLRRGWMGSLSIPPGGEDPYRILRREWGATGSDAWRTLVQGTRRNSIVDTEVTPGKWYEYRLPRSNQTYVQSIWGYAGTERPALTSGPGYAVVVGVDKELLSWEPGDGTLRGKISEYLSQLKLEFGPTQVRMVDLERMQDDVDFNGQLDPKSGPVPIFDVGTDENQRYQNNLRDNKNAISNEFSLIPNYNVANKLIVLIGHVTVPLSGNGAEDGHRNPTGVGSFETSAGLKRSHPIFQPSHLGAWPCDAWYGDFDAIWGDALDLSEGKSAYINGTPRVDWQARNVAGDGKFDHNKIPPNAAGVVGIDAGVGRIDFSKMPGAVKPEDGTGNDRFKRAELRMTANYLIKTLSFHRNDPKDTQQRPTMNEVPLLCGSPRIPAMPVDRFASLGAPALAVSVRQFQGILPDSAWTDLFNLSGISMWGFHGNFGSYNQVGGTWGDPRYSESILANTRWCHSVVTGLMGSFFGDWNHEPENLYPPYDTSDPQPVSMSAGNLLKAILAQSKGGLVVFYNPSRTLDLSRAAAGFPVGVFLRDTVEWYSEASCRTLYLLGDPTLVAR